MTVGSPMLLIHQTVSSVARSGFSCQTYEMLKFYGDSNRFLFKTSNPAFLPCRKMVLPIFHFYFFFVMKFEIKAEP